MAVAPTFRLTTPLMKSGRVAYFQRVLNQRFADWNVACSIPVDGEYGPRTRKAALEVAYGIGIARSDLEEGIPPLVRVKIRDPRYLTRAERNRGKARSGWVKRLKARYDGHGPGAAIAYARKSLGTTEQPPFSNRGPLIDHWNTLVGVPLGSFWCGSFANACLMAAGFPAQSYIAYVPAAEAHARAGLEGWTWQTSPRAGDLVTYGVREAEHVGLVEAVHNGRAITIEGNTSSGVSGSQNNGGGVFRRNRDPSFPGFPVRGFARPPYRR